MLLKEYERRKIDAAADFYESIAGLPYDDAGSLKASVWKRQVLKYFDSQQTFCLRSLSDSESSFSEWIYRNPGPTRIQSITFQSSRVFTSSLRDAVDDNGRSVHFVPAAWDPNFRAVDSILYFPADPLRFV
jgi:hypothetical protein